MSHTSSSVLAELMSVIESRKASRPEGSYTTTLFDAGIQRIGEKVLEEAAELVEAAGLNTPDPRRQVRHEAADLLYHMLVLLAAADVSLVDVEEELAGRFGISGLEEKASRGLGDP